MKLMRRLLVLGAASLLWAGYALADDPGFDSELAAIQQAWAVAQYQTLDEAAKKRAFEELIERAHRFSTAHPQRPEPLIWEGISLSTYAGVKGGLGALGLAKKARTALEQAMKMDANALQGSVYTSLGALYGKVPGFPLGFGNDKTARQYLLKALEINPTGIDPNYFYGDFLLDEKEYDQARTYLQKALAAPARPGRELADQGRRKEINELLARIEAKQK
jgi:tetratricopeptide (TPR) repeat protein